MKAALAVPSIPTGRKHAPVCVPIMAQCRTRKQRET